MPRQKGKRVRFQLAMPRRRILAEELEILHLHFAIRRRHPAALIPMVVDGALLAAFPADREQLEQVGAMDKVPRVVAAGKIKVRLGAVRVGREAMEVIEKARLAGYRV